MFILFMSVSYSDDYIYRRGEHYKLIILIIASGGDGYKELTDCWREYMNEFPGVRSFFVYSDPTIQMDIHVTNDTIVHRSDESLAPGILYKTIAAFSVCNTFFDYDYILRTNLSSFIHIPRLLTFLGWQRKDGYAGGHFNILPDHPSKYAEHRIVNKYMGIELNSRFIFLHGACFVLSRDVIYNLLELVTNTPERIKLIEQAGDDVAISMMLNECLTPCSDERRYHYPVEFENLFLNKYQCKSIEDPLVYGANENIFHFRNKTDDNIRYSDRTTDVANYRNQIKYFYGADGL
jgi:hypothetical protein